MGTRNDWLVAATVVGGLAIAVLGALRLLPWQVLGFAAAAGVSAVCC